MNKVQFVSRLLYSLRVAFTGAGVAQDADNDDITLTLLVDGKKETFVISVRKI